MRVERVIEKERKKKRKGTRKEGRERELPASRQM